MGYELAYMSQKSIDDDQVFQGAQRLEKVGWTIAFCGSLTGLVLLLVGINECNGGNSCNNVEKYYAESQITDAILLLAFTWIIFVVFVTAAGYLRSQIKYQNSNLNLQSEINDKLSQIMNLSEGNSSPEPKRLDQNPSEVQKKGSSFEVSSGESESSERRWNLFAQGIEYNKAKGTGRSTSDPTENDSGVDQSSEVVIPYSEDEYRAYKERERDLKSWTQDMLNREDGDD